MASFPTLESISAVKVAIVICTNASVKRELFCIREIQYDNVNRLLEERRSLHNMLERSVKTVLKNMPLPLLVLDILPFHFRSVVHNAWKWFHYLSKHFIVDYDYSIEVLKASLFTSSGRLDRVVAAREMVLDNRLGIAKRFKVACVFLPPGDICRIWSQMNETQQYYCVTYAKYSVHTLMPKWVYTLASENGQRIANAFDVYCTDEFWTKGFESAAVEGCDVAVEYYWQKLDPDTRHRTAVRTFRRLLRKREPYAIRDDVCRQLYNIECFAKILSFLLSQMEEHQKVGILLEDVELQGEPTVLRCLLDYCEVGFLDMVELSWSVLQESALIPLLSTIAFKSGPQPAFEKRPISTCNYRRILLEFWKQSPSTFKRAAFKSAMFVIFLKFSHDVKVIAFLMKDAPLEEKLTVLRSHGFDIHRACSMRNTKLANEWLDAVSLSQTEKREFLLKEFNYIHSSAYAEPICDDLTAFYNLFEVYLQFEDESTKADLRKEFVRKMSNKIVARLLEIDKIEEVDSFLLWCFSTPEEISDFKTAFLKCSPDLGYKLMLSCH